MNLQNKAKDVSAKAKLIGGSALAFLILLIISMFSGGRAYNLDTLSALFPSGGDITEGCESIVYL